MQLKKYYKTEAPKLIYHFFNGGPFQEEFATRHFKITWLTEWEGGTTVEN